MLLLTGLFSAVQLCGQPYFSFIDTNSTWRDGIEINCSHGSSYLNHVWYDSQEFLKGDTIINSLAYKKLYLTGAKYLFIYNHGDETHDTSFYCNYYIGGLREDSAKVFWVDTNGVEHLRFNFDLQIGDSIDITYGLGFYAVVQSIDSILIANSYRKNINLSFNSATLFLIEGIGTQYGLLGRYDPYSICEGGILRSYFYNDSLAYQYQNSIYLLNCLTNSIDENPESFSTFHLYPNPATNELVIVNPEQGETQIDIYNALGEKVYEQRVTSGIQRTTINIADFSSGIYFLKVNTVDGAIVTKFVKE